MGALLIKAPVVNSFVRERKVSDGLDQDVVSLSDLNETGCVVSAIAGDDILLSKAMELRNFGIRLLEEVIDSSILTTTNRSAETVSASSVLDVMLTSTTSAATSA